MAERPLGVTIIGILWIFGGLLSLMGGLGIAVFGAALGGPVGGAIGLAIGFGFIVIGIIEIILGIGCFKAWSWVWTIGVLITIISLLMGLVSLVTSGTGAILGIIVSAVILYYLFQPHVKAYFGKS